jgi:hypothetical protein
MIKDHVKLRKKENKNKYVLKKKYVECWKKLISIKKKNNFLNDLAIVLFCFEKVIMFFLLSLFYHLPLSFKIIDYMSNNDNEIISV